MLLEMIEYRECGHSFNQSLQTYWYTCKKRGITSFLKAYPQFECYLKSEYIMQAIIHFISHTSKPTTSGIPKRLSHLGIN